MTKQSPFIKEGIASQSLAMTFVCLRAFLLVEVFRFGEMELEQLQHRIKNAILVLTDNNASYEVGELVFCYDNNNHFTVIGYANTYDLKNLTQQQAVKEFNAVKSLFTRMRNAAPQLEDFIREKEIKYCLAYDEGKASIAICSESNGQFKWEIDLIN